MSILTPVATWPGKQFKFIGSATAGAGGAETVDISGIDFKSGDVGILFDYVRQGGAAPTSATPSGHTNHINTTAANARGMISSKILDGTESTITGMDATESGDWSKKKTYLVFRLAQPFSTVTASDTAGQVSNSNPSSQTINASSTGSYPVLVIGQMASVFSPSIATTTSPAMNEVENLVGFYSQYAHWAYSEDSAVNYTYDMGDEGNENCLQSCYLTFS